MLKVNNGDNRATPLKHVIASWDSIGKIDTTLIAIPHLKIIKIKVKYHGKINVKYSALLCYPHPTTLYF